MSALLYRLGHRCARRRWIVIAVWAVLVIGVAVAAKVIGSETSDNLSLPGAGSSAATDLLDDKLPHQANGTVPIVLSVDSGHLDQGSSKRAVKRAVDSVANAPGVRSATSPLSDAGSDNLSKNRRIGYIEVNLSIGPSQLDEDEATAIVDAAQPAAGAGIDVVAGGYLGQEISKPSTDWSERVGLAAAIVILLLALATAVAMSMPIVIAVIGVITGVSAIGLLGHVIEVPTVAPTLATMIGLGVGIDYSLFIVTRYRRRLAEGLEVNEAIARSTATSGSAVTFAGGTVVIALLSLVLARIPIVSALGYSAAIVVVIAVAAATTLLPAILSVVGRRIESLRVPMLTPEHHDDQPHGWARWARGVARWPWPALIAAVAILVVLALPLLEMRLGQEDVGQLPEDTASRQSYDLIAKGFGVGENGPLLIAVELEPPAHNDRKQLKQLNDRIAAQQQQAADQVTATTQQLIAEGVPADQAQQRAESQVSQPSAAQQRRTAEQKQYLKSTASDPRLVKLENRISKAKNVDSVSQAKVSAHGAAAIFTAVPTTAPSAYATQDVVTNLRDDVIPAAVKDRGLTAYVGGTTAGYIDLGDRIADKLPSVIGIVVALSFLLLLLAFRSVLVPLTAALMNLLSVAAAYGVLTAVFEKGWGEQLVGLDHPIPIESFVPLLMFAILFGLSMDYQVFLVSRIDELWRRKADNRAAVVEGLASSARVITAAAAIMVSVFASFILNGDPTVKQFGVGLAVAIAVDATIVRCLLVPAAMLLLGERNWWLPGWLERRLPRVGVESEETLPELPAQG